MTVSSFADAVRVTIDGTLPLAKQPGTGHNRWHPDIEPIANVEVGQELTLETRDGADGQLTLASTAADVLGLDFARSHPLTGPIYVDGAEPGDVLEVDILAYEAGPFGFTPIVPGFGFLADLFPEPFLAKWMLADDRARSEEVPGVAIPGAMFAGVIGVAPSHELLAGQLQREARLAEQRFDVALPEVVGAVPSVAAAGARTVPSRENGGNLDIRELVAGSRLYLPVYVDGALFSVGDLHFAQGDGEVCGSAIEMSGAITVRLSILRHVRPDLRFPSYRAPGRASGQTYATTGISLSESGDAEWMDVGLAARRALVALIDYLTETRGFSRESAYVLASVAAELRISQVVDVPHPLVSAAIPLAIFDE
jgi:formamidase